MTTLWHYTCSHSRARIGDEGLLLPGLSLVAARRDVPWPAQFVWMTDLERPIRSALGLTSNFTRCDRTVHRYRVTDTALPLPWLSIARDYPRDELELSDGARPAHWWVAEQPVPAVYDPVPTGGTR